MPYSVAWNESSPLGSDPASSIDTYIQQDKIAVRERIDDIFGTSGATGLATADPYRPITFKLSGAADTFIIPGSASISIRNNADSADNLKVFNNGTITLRNTLTISSGGITLTAGNATLTLGDLNITDGNIRLTSGQGSSDRFQVTGNGATSVDFNNGLTCELTLTGNTTLTLNNPVRGAYYTFYIKYSGAFTITWPATVKWPSSIAPTLTAIAGRADVITLYYDGAVYVGMPAGFNYTP